LPPASDGQRAFLRALAQRQRAGGPRRGLAGLLLRATWLAQCTSPGGAPTQAEPVRPALPARRAGTVRPQRWCEWLVRLALISGLSHWLGLQQAAYLRRMLRMFDEGQLDAALRHAIPLGGDAG
jgi:hypothetical protein